MASSEPVRTVPDTCAIEVLVMSLNHDALMRLVALVYGAAQDDRGWEPFLVELADAMGGQGAALLSHDLKQTGGVAATVRVDPLVADTYNQHFHKLDAFAHAVHALPPTRRSGVFTGEMLIGPPNYHTEFFNDFAIRFAIPRMMTAIMPTVVDAATGGSTWLTILRSRRDRPFEASKLPLMEALFPHIVRALEVRQRLCRAEETARVLDDVVELLPTPAIVVNRHARIVRANERAHRLLAAGDGLTVSCGVLVAHSSDETSRLQAACGTAARPVNGHEAPGATLTIWRPLSAAPLRLIISPLAPAECPIGAQIDGPCALVLVDEPDAAREPSVPLLRRLYGLTLAEAEIAARIATGEALDGIAEARQCSLQTVQWHNKRILSKMGCRSRPELVRQLTLSLASVVGER